MSCRSKQDCVSIHLYCLIDGFTSRDSICLRMSLSFKNPASRLASTCCLIHLKWLHVILLEWSPDAGARLSARRSDVKYTVGAWVPIREITSHGSPRPGSAQGSGSRAESEVAQRWVWSDRIPTVEARCPCWCLTLFQGASFSTEALQEIEIENTVFSEFFYFGNDG